MVSELLIPMPVLGDIVKGWSSIFKVNAEEQARDVVGMGAGTLVAFGNNVIIEPLGAKIMSGAEGLVISALSGYLPMLSDSDRKDLQRFANFLVAQLSDPTPEQLADLIKSFGTVRDGLFPRFGAPDLRKVASGLGLKEFSDIQTEWANVRRNVESLLGLAPALPPLEKPPPELGKPPLPPISEKALQFG